MQRPTGALAIFAFVLTFMPAAAAPAFAGLVVPGQTITLNGNDFVPPAGTLLEQRTSTFAIQYGNPEPSVGFTGQLAGTLHSAVYRDAGGTLSFLYDVDFEQGSGVSGAAEGSELKVRSFAGFTTSISGGLDFEQLVLGSRSAGGAELSIYSDSPGLGGPPMLLVRTNATAYDTTGDASYFAADELSLLHGSSRLVTGSASIEDVIRPIGGGGGTRPEPMPIPLPPAAYSGLGVLLALGLIALTRRASLQA